MISNLSFESKIAEMDSFRYRTVYCFKKIYSQDACGMFLNISKFSNYLPQNIWLFVEIEDQATLCSIHEYYSYSIGSLELP